MKNDQPINMRWPSELVEQCKAAADAEHRTLSSWLRALAHRELDRLKAERSHPAFVSDSAGWTEYEATHGSKTTHAAEPDPNRKATLRLHNKPLDRKQVTPNLKSKGKKK